MRVIGVDPGLRELGYAVLERGPNLLDAGTIYTSPDLTKEHRLRLIYERLNEEISKHEPKLLCMEKVFLAKNTKSAMEIGEVRGVLFLLCAQKGIEVREIAPLQLKKALLNWGGASKSELALVLRKVYRFSPSTSHEADAIALALCGLTFLERERILKQIGGRKQLV